MFLTGLLDHSGRVILSDEVPCDDEQLLAAVAALEHRGQLPPTRPSKYVERLVSQRGKAADDEGQEEEECKKQPA